MMIGQTVVPVRTCAIHASKEFRYLLVVIVEKDPFARVFFIEHMVFTVKYIYTSIA